MAKQTNIAVEICTKLHISEGAKLDADCFVPGANLVADRSVTIPKPDAESLITGSTLDGEHVSSEVMGSL